MPPILPDTSVTPATPKTRPRQPRPHHLGPGRRAYVERARVAGCDASYVDVGPVGHYLMRRFRAWNELALRSLSLLET